MRTSSQAVVAAIGVLAVAGCGSSGNGSSTSSSGSATTSSSTQSPKGAYGTSSSSAATSAPAGQQVKLSADAGGGLTFEPRSLKARHGTVTLVMQDPSSSATAHGIGVEGNGVDKDGPIVQAGGTAKLTVALKSGRYTYYCPVPAHKQAGMKGTLVVS